MKHWLSTKDFPPAKGDKPAHIAARFAFYDALAAKIKIPGIAVQRSSVYDDEKAQNCGISLLYDSFFTPNPELGLRPEVLLEAGFARTAPNEPRDFCSWALDKALAAVAEVLPAKIKLYKKYIEEQSFLTDLKILVKTAGRLVG